MTSLAISVDNWPSFKRWLREQDGSSKGNPESLKERVAKIVNFLKGHPQFIPPHTFKTPCKYIGSCTRNETCRFAHGDILPQAIAVFEKHRESLDSTLSSHESEVSGPEVDLEKQTHQSHSPSSFSLPQDDLSAITHSPPRSSIDVQSQPSSAASSIIFTPARINEPWALLPDLALPPPAYPTKGLQAVPARMITIRSKEQS